MNRFCNSFFVGAFASALVFLLASGAHAFDGKRKGFILGGGIGGGFASLSQELSFGSLSESTDKETKGTVLTDFRIGGAFNEHWMLYYDNQIWWGKAEFGSDSLSSSEETFAVGIGLVGVSYYLNAEAPSVYFVGTVGVSSFGPSDDYTAQTGFGISGGVGWEFSSHWSLEAVVGWASPDEEYQGATLTTDAVVFGIRVHGLAY